MRYFAVRLARSGLHRQLKGARLGYEDEKGPVSRRVEEPAWLSLGRGWCARRGRRGVMCGSGCARRAAWKERIVSRRDGEAYKRARAARWGDHLEPKEPI